MLGPAQTYEAAFHMYEHTLLSPIDKNTLLQRKLKIFDSTWKITPCLQLLLEKTNTKLLLPIPYQIFFQWPTSFYSPVQRNGMVDWKPKVSLSKVPTLPFKSQRTELITEQPSQSLLTTLRLIRGLTGSSRDHPLFPLPIHHWAHWQRFRTWIQSHPKILLKIHGRVNMHACVWTYVRTGIRKDSNSDLREISQKRTVSQREWNFQSKTVKMSSFSYKTSMSRMHK